MVLSQHNHRGRELNDHHHTTVCRCRFFSWFAKMCGFWLCLILNEHSVAFFSSAAVAAVLLIKSLD